jgi:signal transduction histidine kinase
MSDAPPTNPRSNVLLVDDRRENLMLLEESLRSLDQNLVSVSSGEEALAALLADEFAVILLDVRMPGMDGFETASRIKRRERTRHVPIIFLTAVDDDMETALRGYAEGAVDYITKPFNPAVLRSKVGVFVELNAKTRLLQQQARLLERSNVELAALAEAAESANRAKSAFLNMIGHELRTPLTVVNGYAALLRAGSFGALDTEMERPLEVLETKSEELGELVEMLLAAAQIESGEIPESIERFDINNAVCDAVERARPRAALLNAEVTCEAAAQPVEVDMDPRHMARVFDNLLNNALTYGGEHPWIRVHVRETPDGPAVTVEDRGIGIPDELHARVFERFVRGSSEGAGPPGSGLGLYVCRELLERRGGSLELAESSVGRGSRFVVRMPAAWDRHGREVATGHRREA